MYGTLDAKHRWLEKDNHNVIARAEPEAIQKAIDCFVATLLAMTKKDSNSVIASEAKQSRRKIDCFVATLLAMTE